MSSFTVNLNGRPEDILRELGMSLNDLIRRIVGTLGTKPLRSTFLRPEDAEVGWIRNHVATQVALALQMRPNEKRQLGLILLEVNEKFKPKIDEWIEENRTKLAELIFVRDEMMEAAKRDFFGRGSR